MVEAVRFGSLGGIIVLLSALARSPVTPAPAAASTLRTTGIPTVQTAPPLDPRAPVETWSATAAVDLPWDVTHQQPSSEPTTAHIATDGTNIYVRFDVKQREALMAQQHTNEVGDGTDDEVWIDLWPNGNSGFYYQFAVTSNGTHFQYSSENTAYSPTWRISPNRSQRPRWRCISVTSRSVFSSRPRISRRCGRPNFLNLNFSRACFCAA